MTLANSADWSTPHCGGATNADRAYEIVRERLIMLDIRPGEPINDDRLAGELGLGAPRSARRSSASNAIASSSPTPGAAPSRPPST